MTWQLRGEYLENCNCDILCPCITSSLQGPADNERCYVPLAMHIDRKSTRLNSSHQKISYAVFCLKKKSLSNIILFASSISSTGRTNVFATSSSRLRLLFFFK